MRHIWTATLLVNGQVWVARSTDIPPFSKSCEQVAAGKAKANLANLPTQPYGERTAKAPSTYVLHVNGTGQRRSAAQAKRGETCSGVD